MTNTQNLKNSDNMKRIAIFALLVFIVSACTQGSIDNPSVSFDFPSLNADVQLADYPVEVHANCPWKMTIKDADGNTPSWLDLTKSIGKEDAIVSLRVYTNKYNAERRATIILEALTGKASASLEVVQAASGGGEGTISEKFRIGSYNLRMSGLDTDEDNKWDVRKTRLAQSIRANEFDVFGVQEVSSVQQNWLKEEFKDEYECYFFSPYSASGSGDKAHGILYKKDQYNFSDSHFFWMGDDPHTMSKSDIGTQGEFYRGGCCATFTHRASGVKFFLMCSHGCLNSGPNEKYAHIYEDMEKEYNKESLPSFFVGDLNTKNTSTAYTQFFSDYWKDAYVYATYKTGAGGTYNGYKSLTGNSRIDYIFYRGFGIDATEYHCNNARYGKLYASDHFPIYLDCSITVNKQ